MDVIRNIKMLWSLFESMAFLKLKNKGYAILVIEFMIERESIYGK